MLLKIVLIVKKSTIDNFVENSDTISTNTTPKITSREVDKKTPQKHHEEENIKLDQIKQTIDKKSRARVRRSTTK